MALILSGGCLMMSILNLIFFNSEFLRGCIGSVIFLVMACDFLWMMILNEKEFKNNLIKDYEIAELKFSYKEMGRYIDNFEHADLFDIELRIINELNDIEIRKKHYAESLGIKERDL